MAEENLTSYSWLFCMLLAGGFSVGFSADFAAGFTGFTGFAAGFSIGFAGSVRGVRVDCLLASNLSSSASTDNPAWTAFSLGIEVLADFLRVVGVG
jgi:hypothetical protein